MVYGLAWAACEDNFMVMQENFLAVKGRLARIKGKEGAIMDVLAHITQAEDQAAVIYKNNPYSPAFRKILKAYVQALNDYVRQHPEDVWDKSVFPATEQDIIAAHILATSIISNVQYPIIQALGNNLDMHEIPQTAGSNAFAANENKTISGDTYLCLNSHQPLVGPYSWYEAHLNSEESDINIHGATFPGGMSIFIGANEHLGWGHTINYPDHVDTYKLKMNPKEKLQYELDGKWETLEEYPITLKVKVGPIRLPIKKKFYKSKHGTVIKNKDGYYALRFRANMEARAMEQWFLMNKAKNFDEFKTALEMQQIPGTNLVYADKEGNIYQVSIGLFPKRDKSYNWKKILPGNRSELIWDDWRYPTSALPQIMNPKAGYIYNTNNTPFHCTAKDEWLNPGDYEMTFNYQTADNNRAVRTHHLFEKKDKISFQDFKDIKYDVKYHTPLPAPAIAGLEMMFHLDEMEYPRIAESIKLLKAWDREAKIDRKAAIASLTISNIIREMMEAGLFPGENTVSEEFIVRHVAQSQKRLKKHFGKVDVTIGELQRIHRGDKDYPVGGMPDVLAAMNFEDGKKGRLKAFLGDSFFQFVSYNKDGSMDMETINAFGASAREDSPHFNDQLNMYLNQQTRKVSLDKEEVEKMAKRTYHPGQ